jgi:hypothetical protein
MATLAQEVKDLKIRLARLEAIIQRLVPDTPPTEEVGTLAPLDQTQLVAWLKRQGLARDPTAEERRVAAEWEALPEHDKQTHIAAMHNLHLNPLLSEILMAQRH